MVQDCQHRQTRAKQTDTFPSGKAHDLDPDCRAECRSDVIAQHINGVHPALGIGINRKHAHLIGDLGPENPKIQLGLQTRNACARFSWNWDGERLKYRP